MNVFLIEPPAAASESMALDTAQGRNERFSPPWNLLCLQAFLQKHTRHVCQLIDGRLPHDLEQELVKQIESLSPPRVVVVNSAILSIGQVSAVLEITKRHFPALRTVLCGEFPTLFPDRLPDIPRADYGLSGDPETILRNLLDYIDVPQRLQRTPGLIHPEATAAKAHWVPRLTSLALPDWDGPFWREYAHSMGSFVCRGEMQITRGHTGVLADRAMGGLPGPMREWPMERMASVMSRSAHTEMNEVVLTDPPGYWTIDRLNQWTQALLYVRNNQHWSLSLYPMALDRAWIDDLSKARCCRIDFIVPSCDSAVLARYGLKWDWPQWQETVRFMRSRGIQAFPRFWIGNPEEKVGAAERIAQRIRKLHLLDYRIEPFPYTVDAPIYHELRDAGHQPDVEEWIHWSRDPWLAQRPVPCWGSAAKGEQIRTDLEKIQQELQRSPGLLWARVKASMGSQNWITAIENKAIGYLQRHRKPTLSV